MAEIECLQGGQFGQVREADVGDVGSTQTQFTQPAIRPQVGRRRIGDEFGCVQVQLFELLQLLEAFYAAVGDIGER